MVLDPPDQVLADTTTDPLTTPITPSPEVQFVGTPGPPILEAIAPSGDVRLTLRRYLQEDTLDSASLRFRLDLRIQPRDLYSIPSDGHCGYHTLAVLSHPYYPDPPSATEREELRTTLLERLAQHPDAALRAAALAGQQHPPPRSLSRTHWLRSDWLGLIPALPPLGCLALLTDRDSDRTNPWYYCTASSCSPTQLEHSWSDILRLADSGRLMLHTRDHYHPVTPPPFFSLAIRQCGALLQQQLGGSALLLPGPSCHPTPPPSGPRARRYTATRSLPGGAQLGLSRSSLSPEAQWGVFTLKTIPRGTRILEYGGQLRTQAWLDAPGQNLTYVWSDIDAHSKPITSGPQPVIIDANPAFTDSWGGRINDGFTEGANVEIRRDAHSNKAYVWAIETITPGSELTVHYGPDYWQEHFFSCPDSVQQAAMQWYGLIPIAGQCFQAKELRRLRSTGQAHQVRGLWRLGPRPQPALRVTPGPPARRRACVPLTDIAPPLPPPTPPTRQAAPPPAPIVLDVTSTPTLQPASASPVLATRPPAHVDTTIPTQPDPLLPSPGHLSTDIPFLWLMDIVGSIVDHSVQATWGVTALLKVAVFLKDPAHCNMESLLSWASAYGSPARFHLYHAAPSRSSSHAAISPLGLLAADYGLKARSSSGIRGEDVDDWPCVTDPSELDLLRTYLRQLACRQNLKPAAQDLLAAGLSTDPPSVPLPPSGHTLLELGDPRLPYTLFEPPQSCVDPPGNLLPLLLTGP